MGDSALGSATFESKPLGRGFRRFLPRLLLPLLLSGCMSLPRATSSDEAFADYMHTQAEKFPLPGVSELRTTAAGGHVTLGGLVDSPATLKELVKNISNTPGLTQLSFFGMEFSPADIPDDVIAANARTAAVDCIGQELASQLGFYCENHNLFVYGKLPSLPLREKLDEAVRAVPGVGLYHVSCEVVLENPLSDDQVVAAVRRKFRRPLELPNLMFRASQVKVTSSNNVVYLTGTTPTFLGRLSAGSQAAQVEGVRYVVNQIQVKGPRPTDVASGQISSSGAPLQGEAPGNGTVIAPAVFPRLAPSVPPVPCVIAFSGLTG